MVFFSVKMPKKHGIPHIDHLTESQLCFSCQNMIGKIVSEVFQAWTTNSNLNLTQAIWCLNLFFARFKKKIDKKRLLRKLCLGNSNY